MHKTNRQSGFSPLVAMLVSLVALNAEEEHTLSKVTTQGERIFTYNNEFVVGSKELAQRQSNQVDDMFRTNPDVNVGGGGVMGQKIYVRGIEDRLLRVTVDGAAQNGNIYHHQGNTVIDPQMLKSVIVTKGAANASAGPGAMAGAIAMETKGAADFIPKGKSYAASASASFFTNFGDRENATIAWQGTYIDVLAYYTHQNIFYYRNGNYAFKNLFHPTAQDKEIGTPSEQNNIMVKMNGYISERDTLTLSYNMTRDSATRPLRSNAIGVAQDPDDPLVSIDFTKFLFHSVNVAHNVSLKYVREAGSKFGDPKLDITAYASIRNGKFDPLFNPKGTLLQAPNGLHFLDGSVVKSYEDVDLPASQARNVFLNNSGVNLKVAHTINALNNNLFEYGFNYQNLSIFDARIPKSAIIRDCSYNIEVKDYGDNKPLCQRGQSNGNIYGGYIQANYTFHPVVTLGAGTRYDVYTLYDKDWQFHVTQGFSPSVALVINPVESLSIKLSYAYVTRGALPGDGVYMRQQDLRYVKNLKPEVGQNSEVNIDWQSKYFSGRAAGFYQTISNFINQYAQVLVVGNLKPMIQIYGYEVGGTFKYKGFMLDVAVSRSWPTVKGHLLADSYELAASTGNVIIAKADYTFKRAGLNISWLARFVTNLDYLGYDIYAPNYEGGYGPGLVKLHKPGYGVHSLYVNWDMPFKRFKGLLLSAVFNNIFNKYYVDQASPFIMSPDDPATDKVVRAIAQPGFNARFEVAYKF